MYRRPQGSDQLTQTIMLPLNRSVGGPQDVATLGLEPPLQTLISMCAPEMGELPQKLDGVGD